MALYTWVATKFVAGSRSRLKSVYGPQAPYEVQAAAGQVSQGQGQVYLINSKYRSIWSTVSTGLSDQQ